MIFLFVLALALMEVTPLLRVLSSTISKGLSAL